MIVVADRAARNRPALSSLRAKLDRPASGEPSGPADALWRAVGQSTEVWTTVEPQPFWQALAIVDEAPGSQLDALMEACRARRLPNAPLASLALTGRGFRGQRRRTWAAARGNLHLCVVVPVGQPAETILPALVALPAVAVVEALRRFGVGAQIKWVNDLWLGEAKVGGVLATSICRGEILEQAVLGIGLNLEIAPPVLPTPFVPSVTSISSHGVTAGVMAVGLAVLERLAAWAPILHQQKLATLLAAYRGASCVLGRRVTLWDESCDAGPPESWPAPLARGTVAAINDDLSLTLTAPDAHATRGRLALDTVDD